MNRFDVYAKGSLSECYEALGRSIEQTSYAVKGGREALSKDDLIDFQETLVELEKKGFLTGPTLKPICRMASTMNGMAEREGSLKPLFLKMAEAFSGTFLGTPEGLEAVAAEFDYLGDYNYRMNTSVKVLIEAAELLKHTRFGSERMYRSMLTMTRRVEQHAGPAGVHPDQSKLGFLRKVAEYLPAAMMTMQGFDCMDEKTLGLIAEAAGNAKGAGGADVWRNVPHATMKLRQEGRLNPEEIQNFWSEVAADPRYVEKNGWQEKPLPRHGYAGRKDHTSDPGYGRMYVPVPKVSGRSERLRS